ncbi:MAG TPA: hypothetical protein VGU24_13325 [Microvirga sp.]|nr:hypothetical protein [Microvirga sp.]
MLDPAVIRRYAELAYTSFDTLDLEDAVAEARADLRAILCHLDRADEGPVALLTAVDVVGLEGRLG